MKNLVACLLRAEGGIWKDLVEEESWEVEEPRLIEFLWRGGRFFADLRVVEDAARRSSKSM